MIVIPVLPCLALDETLDFYRALGFTVTHEQTRPYMYGAVALEGIELHFTKAAAKQPGALCLLMVEAVDPYHERFAAGLRAQYGRVPTAGKPRITRLRSGQTRFYLFDPAGNQLLFIAMNEPSIDYEAYDDTLSALGQTLVNASFVRDTYTDDEKAAKVLDKALARAAKKGWEGVAVVDRARALAARAEIAVALGDTAHAAELQRELAALPLDEETWHTYREELEAPQRLARWIETAEVGSDG